MNTRIYSELPASKMLLKSIECFFFFYIFSSHGIKRKKIIKVPPCNSPTLSLYKNAIIKKEDNKIIITEDINNPNPSDQLILSLNPKTEYTKIYVGTIEEIAIVFNGYSKCENFIKINDYEVDFATDVSFLGNTPNILNKLFSIKGYKARRLFLEAVLQEQMWHINSDRVNKINYATLDKSKMG